MATSLTGGVYGFLQKSVGSVTYRTSTSSISGRMKQVVSLKPTKVSNPRTIAQIVQRMKIGPAHVFYAAFEKAAGSVENNPLSHSWEGVQYGAKSRMRFLQLAMQGEPKAYVPKGVNFPVPGVYQISEGTLPSLPNGVTGYKEAQLIQVGSEIDGDKLEALQDWGIEIGDQVTCIALTETAGSYKAAISRVIIGAGNKWSGLGDFNNVEGLGLAKDGIAFDGAAGSVACAAFILSRGISSSAAKRSTAFMSIAPDYETLMSPEAYNKAVESYVEGVSYNSLNSTWYLNQGTTQAFNGEVFFQQLTLPAIEGVAEESVIAVLGRQVDGGSVRYVVFTSNGQSSGTIYARRPGGIATAESWTASRAVQALGAVNVIYAKYTEAIGKQAIGTV